MRAVRHSLALLLLVVSLSFSVSTARSQDASRSPLAAPQSAKIWVGRAAEMEAFLEAAEIIDLQDIPIGVTKPRKAMLAPGGLVDAMTWKPIRPGIYHGFWESYKSEIAAYELDKLLQLEMVPPTVERRIKSETGAAVMWCPGVRSFKDMGGVPGTGTVPGPRPADYGRWQTQITRAKMFDNLVANLDPNLGNWLVDPLWNLILVDHTRAFTTTKHLVHKMQGVDVPLWDKMKALDEPALTTALGAWLDKGAIRAVLSRRDKMRQEFDAMTTARNEASR
jgi:hypothetical protein